MLRNSKIIILICSVAILVATIASYFIIFDKVFAVTMRWVSLLFLIIAQIIGTIKALKIKKDIFGVANLTTSLIHIGVVLILSIVYVNIFPTLIKAYILLNILLLCILLVVDILVMHIAGYILSKEK